MGWKTVLFVTVLVVMIAPRFISYLVSLGYHVPVHRNYPGKCRAVSGTANGSESVELISDGLTLISSGLRFGVSDDNPAYKGRTGQVLLFDFNNPDKEAIPLVIIGRIDSKNFNPHGLSTFVDNRGNGLLYIINQLKHESVVEKFSVDLTNKSLTHLKTFGREDANFHLLNDLVVVGEDKFYYTNYVRFRPLNKLETWLRLTWHSIGYFDGQKGHIVVAGLHKPNGIVASKDGKTIYLANFASQIISVYKVISGGNLRLLQTIYLGSSPDNLNIHEHGNDVTLYAGCSKVVWKTRRYLGNPINYTAPSQVQRITLRKNEDPDVVELFSDDGRYVSASSAAVVYKSKLLIGSVASHALLCDVKYQS